MGGGHSSRRGVPTEIRHRTQVAVRSQNQAYQIYDVYNGENAYARLDILKQILCINR